MGSREETSWTRQDACIANQYSDKTYKYATVNAQSKDEGEKKRKSPIVLSQLLAKFPARLRRPPKPRYKACPNDADGDGGRAMKSDIDDRLVELSCVVPAFSTASTSPKHTKVGAEMNRTYENRHVRLYVRRTNRPVVAYCGLATM